MQKVSPYLQYIHKMTSATFSVQISKVHEWFLLSSGAQLFDRCPCEQGTQCIQQQLLCYLLCPFSPSGWVTSAGWESQSWDFDDVGTSRACCGLDAGSRRVTQRRRRPSLRRPVEAVGVRGQSGRRREADDGRGDAAAFAVDPFALISSQIEVWTAFREERKRDHEWLLQSSVS